MTMIMIMMINGCWLMVSIGFYILFIIEIPLSTSLIFPLILLLSFFGARFANKRKEGGIDSKNCRLYHNQQRTCIDLSILFTCLLIIPVSPSGPKRSANAQIMFRDNRTFSVRLTFSTPRSKDSQWSMENARDLFTSFYCKITKIQVFPIRHRFEDLYS